MVFLRFFWNLLNLESPFNELIFQLSVVITNICKSYVLGELFECTLSKQFSFYIGEMQIIYCLGLSTQWTESQQLDIRKRSNWDCFASDGTQASDAREPLHTERYLRSVCAFAYKSSSTAQLADC